MRHNGGEKDGGGAMGSGRARASGQIIGLRKGGRLDAALALARRAHAADPDDADVALSLGWVLADLMGRAREAAGAGRVGRVTELLRELAGLGLAGAGAARLRASVLRQLTSLAWDLARGGSPDELRALLAALRETIAVAPAGRTRDGEGAAAGRLVVTPEEAEPLLRPLFSAFGDRPDDLADLVAWCGPERFVAPDDVRRGTWERSVPTTGSAAGPAGVPRTPIYVEWVSTRRGAVGVTAYRSEAPREFGPPTVSIERSVVPSARLAGLLRPHEVYDAVLSPDGRSILGTPEVCADERMRSVFVRGFEGRFERVGADGYGFVRLPGGTAASGDVLVPARLAAHHGIADRSWVTGTAAAVFREGADGAEGTWGFVADAVERAVPPTDEERALRWDRRRRRWVGRS